MSNDETLLTHSTNETKHLGVKIGRCRTSYISIESLKDQILQSEYDVCRVCISANDERVVEKLNSLGIPFYFSGSIRRYQTQIKERPEGQYINSNLHFDYYDGSQDNLFYSMLSDTWGDYPLGYYRTPYLNSIITKHSELNALYHFYKNKNLHEVDDEKNRMVFIRHNDTYVGFFALDIVGNKLESHIGGILKPYQKGGYFLDMLRYIKNYCIDNNLSHFCFGARNENSRVQSIFQKVGFTPTHTENVFHVISLLSHTSKLVVESSYRNEDGPAILSFQKKLEAHTKLIEKTDLSHYSIRFHIHSAVSEGPYQLFISDPVKGVIDSIRTIKVYQNNNRLVCSGYMMLQ